MTFEKQMKWISVSYLICAAFGIGVIGNRIMHGTMDFWQVLLGFTIGASLMGIFQIQLIVKWARLNADLLRMNRSLLDHNRALRETDFLPEKPANNEETLH
jgi:hypothetical protein